MSLIVFNPIIINMMPFMEKEHTMSGIPFV